MRKEILQDFFEKYIKGTPEKAIIVDCKIFLCYLTNAVCSGIGVDKITGKVYITSRAVKHLFDRKPAEEFFFLIDNLHKVVKYPNKIYKNKTSKRGEYCLVKRIGDSDYFCSIEITDEMQIATAFRLRDGDYIKKYTLLWSWEDGTPPS